MGLLAVALGHRVYVWTEDMAMDPPPFEHVHPSNYVTSLSFSSEDGAKSILAVGRHRGHLSLWGALEPKVRFEIGHPYPVTCVSFKPTCSRRPSERYPDEIVSVEDLVVGDEMGNIWYYSVEWPAIHNDWSWTGSMTLLAKIQARTQQICGLAWSSDEKYLATGANDNACLLFELCQIVGPPFKDTDGLLTPSVISSSSSSFVPHAASWPPAPAPLLSHAGTLISGNGRSVVIPLDQQKHFFPHSAAVKAIAFAPWQPSLLATGGGGNDRAIHFWHTHTGICLATINVFAQVTSLIWSRKRREIAATFGYASPDHPIRIAVFAWPSCAQISVVPWGPFDEIWDRIGPQPNYHSGRALWAVSYPGRVPRLASDSLETITPTVSRSTTPSLVRAEDCNDECITISARSRRNSRSTRPKEKEGGTWCSRTKEEGCIIVACSDQTIKFHEIWSSQPSSFGDPPSGNLGGSNILEGMEGIERSSGEVIR